MRVVDVHGIEKRSAGRFFALLDKAVLYSVNHARNGCGVFRSLVSLQTTPLTSSTTLALSFSLATVTSASHSTTFSRVPPTISADGPIHSW